MNLDNPIRMVRELKGAPLSILFALTIVGQRVSQAWLEGATGYTDKSISSALRYLEEVGLADHTGAGWLLTGKAKQLPLPLEELEEGEEIASTESSARNENSDDSCQGRKNSTPPIIIITDSDEKEDLSNNNNNEAGGRKNSDSAVLDALSRAKIVGKKRISLSQLAWVTVESISAWEAQLKKELGKRYQPGLLIRMLESGEEPPTLPVEDKFDQYRQGMIKFGLACPSCGLSWDDCECEEEEHDEDAH